MTIKSPSKKPIVGIIMGSKSDWSTLQKTSRILDRFSIPYEAKVVSAHRTPDWMMSYAETAEKRGLQVIIAGAGGAAHLPGMTASLTTIPVIGVPIKTKVLKGLDSLLSIAQMPAGIPVACMAVGDKGAVQAAHFALRILALTESEFRRHLPRKSLSQGKGGQ
jgi:5-(carboxyamino)imidazole ribonucleotide mutase